jgi:hypothetical protein
VELQFYCDPDSDLPHIYGHGVTEQEVLEVFRRNPVRLHGSEGSMFALGQTASGRHLKIVYRQDEREILVITAIDLQGKALKAYRRRKRRKGQ